MAITVCCMRTGAWWFLTIILLLMVMALELASLGVTRWFKQGDEPETDWEGGLLGPTPDSNYFSDALPYSNRWDRCNDGSVSGQDGLCEMWHSLWAGGVIYILFETISLFFISATIFILILDACRSTRGLWLSVVFIWNVLAWHFFALVIWSGLSIMYFDEDCKSITWNNGQSQARVCGKEGPAISLACVLFIPFVALLHTLVYLSVKKQRLSETDGDIPMTTKGLDSDRLGSDNKFEVEYETEHHHHHHHHHRTKDQA